MKSCLLSFLFWIALVGIIGLALYIDNWDLGIVFLASLLAACGMAMMYIVGYFAGLGDKDD